MALYIWYYNEPNLLLSLNAFKSFQCLIILKRDQSCEVVQSCCDCTAIHGTHEPHDFQWL